MPSSQEKGFGFTSGGGASTGLLPRKTHILAVAIDQYERHRQLHNCVSDSESILESLLEHYRFDGIPSITRLYNGEATRTRIYLELKKMAEQIGAEDNFILLFSGHGHYDKAYDEGWWVPVEAELGSEHGYLANDDIRRLLRPIAAKHIWLIVDACFSGTITRNSATVSAGSDLDGKPSRWALTSGRLEPVLDKAHGLSHSPFAAALLTELKTNTQPVLRIPTLGNNLKDPVRGLADQIPDCLPVDKCGHMGGEMVLLRKATAVEQNPVAGQAFQSPVAELLRRGSREYYDLLQIGRFKHLNIADELLTDMKGSFITDTEVKMGDQATPLRNSLQVLAAGRDRHTPHGLLFGDGGMGKTVSTVRLWEEMLEENAGGATPLFVALNEFNNAQEHEHGRYLIAYIARHYLGREFINPADEAALREALRKPLADGKPAFVLLLDGFNEITVEKRPLLLELNQFVEQFKGVQMLVTTRYGINDTWATEFNKLELLPLTRPQITLYLNKAATYLPSADNQRLWKLLENPMMLTLYAGVGKDAEKYKGDRRLDFKTSISTPGELIWNFLEIQLAKQLDPAVNDEATQAYLFFLVRCVLPYIAFRMEEAGQYYIAESGGAVSLENTVLEALAWFDRPETHHVYPDLRGRLHDLDLGPAGIDWKQDAQRFDRALNALSRQLKMLVPENGSFRFLHQNFRDALSAVWILNDVRFHTCTMAHRPGAVSEGAASTLFSRRLPPYLRLLIGEIEQEHHNQPLWVELQQRWTSSHYKQTILSTQLDLLRRQPEQFHIAIAIHNILAIWIDCRGSLAGADLRELDLSACVFNGVVLSYGHDHGYLSADLSKSALKAANFFPQGHNEIVTCLAYNPQGHLMATGAVDQTVRVWDLHTGECIQKFEGHTDAIRSISFHPSGQKLVTGSNDKTIREWDLQTGKCRILSGHDKVVCYVNYHPTQNRIISGAWDKTIREWNLDTGLPINTIFYKYDTVNSVQYSPDGSFVLAAFLDGFMEEWELATGAHIQHYSGHQSYISEARYSPDGRLIVSSSYDKTIRIWERNSGNCKREIKGFDDFVSSVDFSPDGRKVLCGCWDKAIYEWDVASGECLRIFKGHNASVTRVAYNYREKKIVSASADHSIREWSLSTGECTQIFKGYEGGIEDVSVSPDGRYAIASTRNLQILRWDVDLGQCGQLIPLGYKVKSIAFSPSGDRALFSSEKKIYQWDLKKNALIGVLNAVDQVNSLHYSPDGNMALSTNLTGEAALWDLQKGKLIQLLFGHRSRICGVDFSADGSKILSISTSKNVLRIAVSKKEKQVQNLEREQLDRSASGKSLLIEWDLKRKNETVSRKININFGASKVTYAASEQAVYLGGFFNQLVKLDLNYGQKLRVFDDYESRMGMPIQITMHPDKKRLILFTAYGAVMEHDLESGRPLFYMHVDTALFGGRSRFSWMDVKYHPNDDADLLFFSMEVIVHYSRRNDQVIKMTQLVDVPGLLLQHCQFKNVQWKETGLEPKNWRRLLRLYGAVLDED